MHLLVPTLFTFIPFVLSAQRNVTVDDSDPSVIYEGGQWSISPNNTADYNGTRHTTFPTPLTGALATATLNFTGVAIYYMSSYFVTPNYSTTLTLDGGAPVVVPLSRPEDIASSVVWGMTGLSNGLHTVVNSNSAGGSDGEPVV
ncbi:hypothetical protein B0H13DRAFT_1908035 [Mycena leptocephala]|nr:hypothetical protein B0H13DRAFT_1908035 [Mycena leptocephala]